MSFGELIPQVFYDGIARFVAGLSAIGTCLIVWRAELGSLLDLAGKGLTGASVITAFVFLLAAYIVALLLEGLRHFIEWILKLGASRLRRGNKSSASGSTPAENEPLYEKTWERSLEEFEQAFEKIEPQPDRPSRAYAIDAVRLANTDVGARIVKLRAEVACCKTLRLAWTIIAVSYIPYFLTKSPQADPTGNGVIEFVATLLLLGLAATAIHFRQARLSERYLTALFNHWLLLVKPRIPTGLAESRSKSGQTD